MFLTTLYLLFSLNSSTTTVDGLKLSRAAAGNTGDKGELAEFGGWWQWCHSECRISGRARIAEAEEWRDIYGARKFTDIRDHFDEFANHMELLKAEKKRVEETLDLQISRENLPHTKKLLRQEGDLKVRFIDLDNGNLLFPPIEGADGSNTIQDVFSLTRPGPHVNRDFLFLVGNFEGNLIHPDSGKPRVRIYKDHVVNAWNRLRRDQDLNRAIAYERASGRECPVDGVITIGVFFRD